MREQPEEAERRQHQAGGKLHVHHWILRQEHGVTRSCLWTQLRTLGSCGKPVNERKGNRETCCLTHRRSGTLEGKPAESLSVEFSPSPSKEDEGVGEERRWRGGERTEQGAWQEAGSNPRNPLDSWQLAEEMNEGEERKSEVI